MNNHHLSHHAIDMIKVGAANLGAITITLANVQASLSIISLLVAISYTVWKWVRDSKKNK